MGDETVCAIAESLRDTAFANGVSDAALYELVSELVDRLRKAGIADDAIVAYLTDQHRGSPSDG